MYLYVCKEGQKHREGFYFSLSSENTSGNGAQQQTLSRIHSLSSESAMAALQYLDSLRNANPEMAEWYNSLADLYQKKLWHQLTLKLEQFVAHAVSQVSHFRCSFSASVPL